MRWHKSDKFSEPQNEIKAGTWEVSKDQSKLRIKAWLSSSEFLPNPGVTELQC